MDDLYCWGHRVQDTADYIQLWKSTKQLPLIVPVLLKLSREVVTRWSTSFMPFTQRCLPHSHYHANYGSPMSSSRCQRKVNFPWWRTTVAYHSCLIAEKVCNSILLNMLIPSWEATRLISDQVAAVHNRSTFWEESWKVSRNTNSPWLSPCRLQEGLGIPKAVVSNIQVLYCILTSAVQSWLMEASLNPLMWQQKCCKLM